MKYNRCGKSGLLISAISLGLWHNFGNASVLSNQKEMVLEAFNLGITNFDLANNYGPPPGSAEENFGRILHEELLSHRDEMLVSTKAGYYMWPGPYGDWGSRKYLLSSLDQSLKRMKLDYVDIFYSHRPDLNTPIEETMGALDTVVKQGKALYVGISNYTVEQTLEASKILKRLGTPCLIHQPKYSMFNRWIEAGLQDVLDSEGIGSIAFCPLAQGQLTNKYFDGIPKDSRVETSGVFLKEDDITENKVNIARKLNDIAVERGQSLAQMALTWVLRKNRVTSALIGASRVSQIIENVEALKKLDFSDNELLSIDEILAHEN